MMGAETLHYVVGEERGLRDLLDDAEMLPLLDGALQGGCLAVRVVDQEGEVLWSAGAAGAAELSARFPVVLEGEPVASVELYSAAGERAAAVAGCAPLLRAALDAVLVNKLKRVLTTEIHTSVVNSSYQELVRANAELSASEARYRELAEHLEQRVKERTAELREAHARLMQQEKMAGIGRLAAGVAHEINNPLGFIISNLHTLERYVARYHAMLHFYREHQDRELRGSSEAKWRELKLPQVTSDVGDLLSQSLNGAERVRRIVADLKGFSHVDERGEAPLDLNAEVERTLGVLAHALREATVVRELQPLPRITCPPQLPGQIFLNLVQNALAHAGPRPLITVTSLSDGERITIAVADNGPGVPLRLRGQIFEPFFTTLPVGSGTGLGLALVYDAVRQLGGEISVGDAAGGGAEFVVTIPLPKD